MCVIYTIRVKELACRTNVNYLLFITTNAETYIHIYIYIHTHTHTHTHTEWSKRFCAPDDCNHQVHRLFHHPVYIYRVIKAFLCTWRLYCTHHVHRDFFITLYIYRMITLYIYRVIPCIYSGWSKRFCAPDDCIVINRCTETFQSPCI